MTVPTRSDHLSSVSGDRLAAAARTAELHVVIAIEAAPHVYVDALNDGEEARLLDWIEHAPAIRALVDRALELRDQAA